MKRPLSPQSEILPAAASARGPYLRACSRCPQHAFRSVSFASPWGAALQLCIHTVHGSAHSACLVHHRPLQTTDRVSVICGPAALTRVSAWLLTGACPIKSWWNESSRGDTQLNTLAHGPSRWLQLSESNSIQFKLIQFTFTQQAFTTGPGLACNGDRRFWMCSTSSIALMLSQLSHSFG